LKSLPISSPLVDLRHYFNLEVWWQYDTTRRTLLLPAFEEIMITGSTSLLEGMRICKPVYLIRKAVTVHGESPEAEL
jgi:hypothetical protein